MNADLSSPYLDSLRDAMANRGTAEREAAVNYAATLIERGFPVIFDQQHLAVQCGVRSQQLGDLRADIPRSYSHYRIPKRNGGSRGISVPHPKLRTVQDWVHGQITSKMKVHGSSHGFVRGRSIITNARPHVGAELVMKLDIRDFFGHVTRATVFRSFRAIGYSHDVSNLLASLLTLRGSVPQGAPTSPQLANIAARKMDSRIQAFATANGLTYSRYADDVTISGPKFERTVRRTVEQIMRSEGFPPNHDKTRYVNQSDRMAVTGIVVNKQLSWPRTRRRWIRQEVHFLTKFGPSEHLRRRGYDRLRYRNFIYGHLYALNAIHPGEARPLLVAVDAVDWSS